jgi:uncharacterized tellurite resistance protein B-like protein/ribosome biogenesis GTPase A
MTTALVDSEAVELLSRVTGQKLSQKDITPPVIFTSVLVTVLWGVIYADGTVAPEEEQQLQETLNRLVPPEHDLHKLVMLLKEGVQKQLVSIDELLTLTNLLSESEKLLLISFGYQMSAADADMDILEKRYLDKVATRLLVQPRHQSVIEAAFSGQEITKSEDLDEVRSLLDPARFQSLDTLFVNGASHILEDLSIRHEHRLISRNSAFSHKELEKFKEIRQQLTQLCERLFKIIQDGNERSLLDRSLIKEIGKVSQKIQSQSFRIAVVGEFSKGKSTLLNAILGEEIQPVRAIPCSGTVTVLKYGQQRRVVCRYKNGREEEIPFEQYQAKASISREAAINNRSDELARCEIDEILFEHPDLELCRNGVEILDSPGLNEHPEREKITLQLIQNTDAVIFLTNALQVLTEKERDLLQKLRTQLNGGKLDESANNLFVVVNFMDLLRREKDRQDVQQLVETLRQGQSPIITKENRIHFISAQAALDAILDCTENDYLKEFQHFIHSLEKFLTTERGSLKIQQPVTAINRLIQSCLHELHQAEELMNGKIQVSEADKHRILKQIGEARVCDKNIRNIGQDLKYQVFEQSKKSWNEWRKGLEERLTQKSKKWTSEHNQVFSQKSLIRDYINQFKRDLSQEIEDWGNLKLRNKILEPNLKAFEEKVNQELEVLKTQIVESSNYISVDLNDQLDLSVEKNFFGLGAIGGGIGFSIPLALAAAFTANFSLPLVILAGAVVTIASSLGFGMLDVDQLKNQIKDKILDLGYQNFERSQTTFESKLNELISSVFGQRVEAVSGKITKVISQYETLLEQQEKAHKDTLEQRQADKAFIAQKRQELEQVQKNIEAILHP